MRRNPRKVLGDEIRKKREELGLTQEQLAERADMHWTSISGIERGQHNITIDNLILIAAALKTKVRDLVNDL